MSDKQVMAALCIIVIALCISIALVGRAADTDALQSARPGATCQPCKETLPCITVIAPTVPRSTDTPQPTATNTTTPEPTETPRPTATPEPTAPNLAQYTQTTFVIWPQNRKVDAGAPFTDGVYLADFDGVDAVEMYVVYNPVVLTAISATVASGSACAIWKTDFRPTIVNLQCEGITLDAGGRLFDLTFTANVSGTSLIDTTGKYAFAGTRSGWAFKPSVYGAWVTVQQ